MPTVRRADAAAIVIGDEVLSAKVADQNGPLLTRRLREHGLRLRSLSIIPDEIDWIREAVNRDRERCAHVFTSGGIGPTHDDLTVRAVASALGRDVVRLPEMVERITRHFEVTGREMPPEALRLAEAPEGAELWDTGDDHFPVLVCENLYLLPGVPALFAMQLETVLARLDRGAIHLRCLYLAVRETEIAGELGRIAEEVSPEVAIGSYPCFDAHLDFEVKLTVEGEVLSAVESVVARLIGVLPRSSVIRVE